MAARLCALAAAFLSLSLFSANAAACIDGPPVPAPQVFTGEVNAGDAFRQQITSYYCAGQGGDPVYFRLVPNDHGWVMQMGPEEGAGPDYIYMANPPYRFNPLQYLDGSYGQHTLDMKERRFSFLAGMTAEDGKAATDAINRILWPKSDADQDEGLKALGLFEKEQGALTILNAEINHDKDGNEIVSSLKFRVEIDFSGRATDCM